MGSLITSALGCSAKVIVVPFVAGHDRPLKNQIQISEVTCQQSPSARTGHKEAAF